MKQIPRHATSTSFKPGINHINWKGGCYNYCHNEARKIVNAPKGKIVHHKDKNWKNNSLNNLYVTTQGKHATIHNKDRTGSIKPNSKIRQVIENVLKLKNEKFSRKEIANRLFINERMVKRCLTKTWRCQYE